MIHLTPFRRWTCPNCTLEQTTHEARPHTRFHSCPGLKGLTAPMVEAGVKCEVRAVEREDYAGLAEGNGQAYDATIVWDDDETAILLLLGVL